MIRSFALQRSQHCRERLIRRTAGGDKSALSEKFEGSTLSCWKGYLFKYSENVLNAGKNVGKSLFSPLHHIRILRCLSSYPPEPPKALASRQVYLDICRAEHSRRYRRFTHTSVSLVWGHDAPARAHIVYQGSPHCSALFFIH